MAQKKKQQRTPNQPAAAVNEAASQRSHEKFMMVVNLIGNLARLVFVLLTVFGCIYFGVYKTVVETAGKTTVINYFAKWVLDASIHVWLAWSAAGICAYWAYKEKQKRLAERKEKDGRIMLLEKQIDPGRTSSGMALEGESEIQSESLS